VDNVFGGGKDSLVKTVREVSGNRGTGGLKVRLSKGERALKKKTIKSENPGVVVRQLHQGRHDLRYLGNHATAPG